MTLNYYFLKKLLIVFWLFYCVTCFAFVVCFLCGIIALWFFIFKGFMHEFETIEGRSRCCCCCCCLLFFNRSHQLFTSQFSISKLIRIIIPTSSCSGCTELVSPEGGAGTSLYQQQLLKLLVKNELKKIKRFYLSSRFQLDVPVEKNHSHVYEIYYYYYYYCYYSF